MGVPSFFRWLLEKYPRVIQQVLEEHVKYNDETNKREFPDSSGPNPNGIEFDNLYLDMNGIIHPCSHPENGPQPSCEEEMIENVFEYIDHIFSMIRPRKVLYLAIDGVAPRAKMNQQRARRFRAAQERLEIEEARAKLRRYYKKKGKTLPPQKPPSWDYNVITPGTPFMDKLTKALEYWIAVKLNSDPGWKNIKVILSDANVPGEGEHKIAQWIRRVRLLPGYDANTKHVLYGLDADLFMLGLATHEPYFYILREEVLFGKDRPCEKCGEKGHYADRCLVPDDEIARRKKFELLKAKEAAGQKRQIKEKPFVLAYLYILREYLKEELFIENAKFNQPLWDEEVNKNLHFNNRLHDQNNIGELAWVPEEYVTRNPQTGRQEVQYNYWDLERVIDDFVFLCFFVGNDFLPHLPSLEIREGAIDNLLKDYKTDLPNLGGYLTDGKGHVNLERVSKILAKLGSIEDEVFRTRKEHEKISLQRAKQKENQKRKDVLKQRKKLKNKNSSSSSYGEPPNKRARLSVNSKYGTTRRGRSDPNDDISDTDLAEFVSKEEKDFMDFFDEIDLKVDEHFLTMDFEHQLKRICRTKGDLTKVKKKKSTNSNSNSNGKNISAEEGLTGAMFDTINMGDSGWKARYYRSKLSINFEEDTESVETGNSNDNSNSNNSNSNDGGYRRIVKDETRLDNLCYEYIRGLCWVLLYYYQGCPSWSWYFPFHYSPLASDLGICAKYKIEFEEGIPFSPYGQLMGVLPATSGAFALPKKFHALMCNPLSPIIHFYPTDFKLDLNGKRFAWQGVIILPFIEEKTLLKAIEPLEKELDAEPKRMNSTGKTFMFVNCSHPIAKSMKNVIKQWQPKIAQVNKADFKDENRKKAVMTSFLNKSLSKIDENLCQGIHGFIGYDSRAFVPNRLIPSPTKSFEKRLKPIKNGCDVVSSVYELPTYVQHCSRLLDGVIVPDPTLTQEDINHMKFAHRFGKPRKPKQKDTHFNYNRGWDWHQGHLKERLRNNNNNNNRNNGNNNNYGNKGEFDQNRFINTQSSEQQLSRRDYDAVHGGRGNGAYFINANDLRQKRQNERIKQQQARNESKNNENERKERQYSKFEPYPMNGNAYHHRPSNAPVSSDPKTRYDRNSNSNNNNNSNRNRQYAPAHHSYAPRTHESSRSQYGQSGRQGGGAGGAARSGVPPSYANSHSYPQPYGQQGGYHHGSYPPQGYPPQYPSQYPQYPYPYPGQHQQYPYPPPQQGAPHGVPHGGYYGQQQGQAQYQHNRSGQAAPPGQYQHPLPAGPGGAGVPVAPGTQTSGYQSAQSQQARPNQSHQSSIQSAVPTKSKKKRKWG